MLDQFYWAEKMFWLGVAPEPLKRNHLFPEDISDTSIRASANVLSQAIHDALSPRVKARASEVGKRIFLEVNQWPPNCYTFLLSNLLISNHKADKYWICKNFAWKNVHDGTFPYDASPFQDQFWGLSFVVRMNFLSDAFTLFHLFRMEFQKLWRSSRKSLVVQLKMETKNGWFVVA